MKKERIRFELSRRQMLKVGFVAGVGMLLPWHLLPKKALAVSAATGLSDPALQPKFVELAPNALHPAFKFSASNINKGKYQITIDQGVQFTGLVDESGRRLPTPVWGYGRNGRGVDWPGRTLEVRKGIPIEVTWENKLLATGKGPYLPHLLPVDASLHWAYSLSGYEQYTIEDTGVPVIPHLHGGHSDAIFDGHPEAFFSPGYRVRGPLWVEKKFIYSNDQPAAALWYHDHALGITRLNVYAGLAGFYFIRDDEDTGLSGNRLDLPAYPYELAYAIQDRMFFDSGELFYPAFPGDPYYEDFISEPDPDGDMGDGGVFLPPGLFPGGGPTILAEFFGDHMVVNGKIWPKTNVEPRNYRMRLLNGCDSRFMAIQFVEVPAGATTFESVLGGPLNFTVIGGDQGLAAGPTEVNTLIFEPGARYDVIFDFKNVTPGNRVIMKNVAGDEPFGGTLATEDPELRIFEFTDRIMAFDVILPLNTDIVDESPSGIAFGPTVPEPVRTRKVALFEGSDDFGRLQPLLGTAEPATDYQGNPINWPDIPEYSEVGLVGQMEGSIGWHSPTTENPELDSTEEWEIWNMTEDAHPIHLHLVNFQIVGRRRIVWDSATNEDSRVLDANTPPAGDGSYLVTQPVVQYDTVAGFPETYGSGFKLRNPTSEPIPDEELPGTKNGYVENFPKDLVVALPEQVTIIRARFDKAGRYVWHCHILSHEDHEMMRVLHVGSGA